MSLTALLARVRYRDWQWIVNFCGDGFYLQLSFTAPDTETGIPGVQKGGKFYVSRYAAENEVIRTAHAAVISAVTHEANEEFRVDGVAIYHPHISLSAMRDAAAHHEYRA